MQVLKVELYQPTTHFRIPFTYQRRHTYPLPPYSTIIGFLVNVMGLIRQNDVTIRKLQGIKLSVSGNYEVKTTEYIWFRNLDKETHKKKFGTFTNREINGQVQHPGGQSPISIDTLDNFFLTLHIWHEDISFLNEIKANIENPLNRLEILHLGRAEDWIVLESIEFVELTDSNKHKNFRRFIWIPEKCKQSENRSDNTVFQALDGLIYRLPTFAHIENYEQTYNRHAKRNFDYITTKLSEGIIKDVSYLYDEKADLPVFLADLEPQNIYEH